jgi:hypothetical protein
VPFILSLPFDPSSVPQHGREAMRIRQFALSYTGNLSFYQVEQIQHNERCIRSAVLNASESRSGLQHAITRVRYATCCGFVD